MDKIIVLLNHTLANFLFSLVPGNLSHLVKQKEILSLWCLILIFVTSILFVICLALNVFRWQASQIPKNLMIFLTVIQIISKMLIMESVLLLVTQN